MQAEGADWQRQRKLTATPFNEQKSVLVWQEAIAQTREMLNIWQSYGEEGFTTTSDDTRTVALHVLAYVAFHKSYPFGSQAKTIETKTDLTYRDSIAIILENIFLILIFPTFCFTLPGLPTKWKRIGWAVESFRHYMLGQVKEEQKLKRDGQPGTGTLVRNLVRGEIRSEIVKPLTEAEILGNIFVFNFAGHDTTAISLAFAVLLLVTDPAVQDWIHEEITEYVKTQDLQNLDYSATFPKLKRCMAVLVSTCFCTFLAVIAV
jgi:cytochrome P450